MTFKEKPSPLGIGTWFIGREEFDAERDLTAWVKVVEKPSETYGINGGKIVLLEITIGDEIIAHYDNCRGWLQEVSEEAQQLYESILNQFN